MRERRQFVQVNDKTTELVDVQFGVSQGSILGPVLINSYANDLNDIHDGTVWELNSAMRTLVDRSNNSNLLLNAKKTKQMMSE